MFTTKSPSPSKAPETHVPLADDKTVVVFLDHNGTIDSEQRYQTLSKLNQYKETLKSIYPHWDEKKIEKEFQRKKLLETDFIIPTVKDSRDMFRGDEVDDDVVTVLPDGLRVLDNLRKLQDQYHYKFVSGSSNGEEAQFGLVNTLQKCYEDAALAQTSQKEKKAKSQDLEKKEQAKDMPDIISVMACVEHEYDEKSSAVLEEGSHLPDFKKETRKGRVILTYSQHPAADRGKRCRRAVIMKALGLKTSSKHIVIDDGPSVVREAGKEGYTSYQVSETTSLLCITQMMLKKAQQSTNQQEKQISLLSPTMSFDQLPQPFQVFLSVYTKPNRDKSSSKVSVTEFWYYLPEVSEDTTATRAWWIKLYNSFPDETLDRPTSASHSQPTLTIVIENETSLFPMAFPIETEIKAVKEQLLKHMSLGSLSEFKSVDDFDLYTSTRKVLKETEADLSPAKQATLLSQIPELLTEENPLIFLTMRPKEKNVAPSPSFLEIKATQPKISCKVSSEILKNINQFKNLATKNTSVLELTLFDEKKSDISTSCSYEVEEIKPSPKSIALVMTGGYDPPHPYHVNPFIKGILKEYEQKKEGEWKDRDIYVFFLPSHRSYLYHDKRHGFDKSRPLLPEYLRIKILKELIEKAINSQKDFPSAIHPYVDISECAANGFWDYPQTLRSFKSLKKFHEVYHIRSDEGNPYRDSTTIIIPTETGFNSTKKGSVEKFSSTHLMEGTLTIPQIQSTPVILDYLKWFVPLVTECNRVQPFINPKEHKKFSEALKDYSEVIHEGPEKWVGEFKAAHLDELKLTGCCKFFNFKRTHLDSYMKSDILKHAKEGRKFCFFRNRTYRILKKNGIIDDKGEHIAMSFRRVIS